VTRSCPLLDGGNGVDPEQIREACWTESSADWASGHESDLAGKVLREKYLRETCRHAPSSCGRAFQIRLFQRQVDLEEARVDEIEVKAEAEAGVDDWTLPQVGTPYGDHFSVALQLEA